MSDTIDRLGQTHTKRVTVRGISHAPALDGIKDVKAAGDALTFLYSGSPDVLLKALAAAPLTDINIVEPDLEEIFLHFYREEDEAHDDSES